MPVAEQNDFLLIYLTSEKALGMRLEKKELEAESWYQVKQDPTKNLAEPLYIHLFDIAQRAKGDIFLHWLENQLENRWKQSKRLTEQYADNKVWPIYSLNFSQAFSNLLPASDQSSIDKLSADAEVNQYRPQRFF